MMTPSAEERSVKKMADAITAIVSKAPSYQLALAALQIATGDYLYEICDTPQEMMAFAFNYVRLLTDQVNEATTHGWDHTPEPNAESTDTTQ